MSKRFNEVLLIILVFGFAGTGFISQFCAPLSTEPEALTAIAVTMDLCAILALYGFLREITR